MHPKLSHNEANQSPGKVYSWQVLCHPQPWVPRACVRRHACSPAISSLCNSQECSRSEQPLCTRPQLFSLYFQTPKFSFEMKGFFLCISRQFFPGEQDRFRLNKLVWNFTGVSHFTLFSANASELQQPSVSLICDVCGRSAALFQSLKLTVRVKDRTIRGFLSFFSGQIQ